MKYVVLHKIGIANWCPSTHGSGVSPILASLLYQIGTRSTFNFGVFVFNHLLRHVDSFAIKLPICFPCLLSGFLIAQCPSVLGLSEGPSPDPSVLNLSYKLFQGSHVPDIVHNIRPLKAVNIPLPKNLQVHKGGLHISIELGTHILHILPEGGLHISIGLGHAYPSHSFL